MRNKTIIGLIFFVAAIFFFPQTGLTYDVCLQDEYGYQFYMTLNPTGSGFTGYVDVDGTLYPFSGSYTASGGFYYLNIDTNAYCGDGFNPAKQVIKLDSTALNGTGWAHAFRCDGTIDMFENISWTQCGGNGQDGKPDGPTPFMK